MWSCCHHTLLRAARCLCADPPDKPCSTPLMKCLVSFDLVSLMKCLVSLTWSHWWNVWSLWLGLTDEMLGLPDQPYVAEDVSLHLLPAMKTSMWHCLVSALCKWHTHVCTHTHMACIINWQTEDAWDWPLWHSPSAGLQFLVHEVLGLLEDLGSIQNILHLLLVARDVQLQLL